MPLVKHIETEIGPLGIWELTESTTSLLAAFRFSEATRAEFNPLKFEKRQREYLATRLLLGAMLQQDTEIVYSPSGKPKLKNHLMNISISHSDNLVVILLSDKKAGIDVEIANRPIDRVAHRFLSPVEMLNVQNCPDPQKAKIIYWGAKESIFKATDFKGIQFDRQIAVSPFPIEAKGCFFARLNTEKITEEYKLWYFSHQNNSIVYCVEVE